MFPMKWEHVPNPVGTSKEKFAGAKESSHPSGQELKADTSVNTYARVSALTSLTSLTSFTPANERTVAFSLEKR